MPLTFSTTRTIAALPDRVFEAMTNLDLIRSWMPHLVSLEPLSEGPTGVGTRWRETRQIFGKQATEVFEVTAFEPSTRLVLFVDGSQGTTGRGSFRFDYELSEEPGGTRLSSTATIDMGGGFFAGLLLKLMGGTFRKQTEKDLDAMQRHVEEIPSSSPASVSPTTD